MALDENKRKSPYHGVFLASFLMVLVPVVCYIVFRALLFNGQTHVTDEMNEASAKALGFGIGFLFHMACIIAGVLEESFKIVVHRVVEFFDNLKFSFKLACNCYADDIRENGVAFWIMFGVMVVNFCIFWSGLKVVIAPYLG